MQVKDIKITKRPRFEDEDLKRFEERMKNIEWDNENGKGILSEEDVKKIADTIVRETSIKHNSPIQE